MAITIPSDLELLSGNDLVGNIPFDEDPLHTLLRRTNWLYATHAPPVLNVCPYSEFQNSSTYIVPCPASLDGLTYQCSITAYCDAGTINVTLETSPDGSSWSNVTGWNPNGLTAALTGDQFWGQPDTSALTDVPVPTGTNYLRITITQANALLDVQLQGFCLYPKKLTSIAAGTKASGFVPYDDGHLTSTGAAIHTEYINRAAYNVWATMRDRKQMLTCWAQEASGPLRLTGLGYLFYGVVSIPPEAAGDQVTVRVKATDAGTGYVMVGQKNGNYVALDSDGTIHTDTLTLNDHDDLPVLYCLVKADSGTDVEFVSVEWAPTLGSDDPLLSAPAPAAKVEFLGQLDHITLEGCVRPYAQTCLHFDPSEATGSDWHGYQVVAPGTRALRLAVTRSPSQATGSTLAATTVSSKNDGNEIEFASESQGVEEYPPNGMSHIVLGSQAYDAAAGLGENRMLLTDEDREPCIERLVMDNCVALSGIPDGVADLSAV
jgi:hypothetical protein